jgi:hypothetical protein
VDKDIGRVVGITGNQVGRLGNKSHHAAIGRDGRQERIPVALRTGRRDRDACGEIGLAVVDKDIGCAVGIAQDQIVGARGESHEATIGGNRRRRAARTCIAGLPVGANREAFQAIRAAIIGVDVPQVEAALLRILRQEVGRARRKGHNAAVGGKDRIHKCAIGRAPDCGNHRLRGGCVAHRRGLGLYSLLLLLGEPMACQEERKDEQ